MLQAAMTLTFLTHNFLMLTIASVGFYDLQINPFLPTGQFFALKLIISIKCLIDILFLKVLF